MNYTEEKIKLQIAVNELSVISQRVDLAIVNIPDLSQRTSETERLIRVHKSFLLVLEALDDTIALIEDEIQESSQ